MLNSYELTVIFPLGTGDDDRKKIFEDIKKIISPGKVKDQKDWGKRVLAYPIKKEKEGNYYLLKLEAGGKEIVQLSSSLKMNGKVLRHLIVRS